MTVNRKSRLSADREPMGIVIADGGSPEVPSRFLAYVWGPVPDEDEAPIETPELVGAAS